LTPSPLLDAAPFRTLDVPVKPLSRARKVFDIEIAALASLRRRLDRRFTAVLEALGTALSRGGKIVVLGVGKSGHIGDKIAATFTSTGAPAVVLNALNALHGDLGIVARGDAVIVLSSSGETGELLSVLPALKREAGVLIALTGRPRSSLATAADHCLDVSVEQEACPLNLAPTSSTTAMLVMGDALAMALLEQRGFRREDFARFHPGGTLGRTLLLKASDLMRPLQTVAVLPPSATVREAVRRMAEKRCGAVIVTAPSGRLAGIYTHGDFGRSYSKEGDIGSRRLRDAMIAKPVTVVCDRLAGEVLRIFEDHRISDLVVLDSRGRPAGLIDVQDLARLKLI
jgi:arabinose-5-phosphate isomerase